MTQRNSLLYGGRRYTQNDKRVEVEFRGLLSKKDYNKVVEKLKKEGELVRKFKRLLLAYSIFKERNKNEYKVQNNR